MIDVSDSIQKFEWISPLQEAFKNKEDLLLLAHNDPTSGILGLVNCIRREPSGDKTRCVFLQTEAPRLNLEEHFYKEQLRKGFAVNVYKDGKWGTYRHLLLNNKQIVGNCTVHITRKGDLSSFKWIENNHYISQRSELVHVCYIYYPCF